MTDQLKTELLSADTAGIRRAAELLREGRLVAFGTETVYGLGAIATSDRAVARVFAAKGRPRFNPLISHLPDAESAFAQASLSGRTEELAHILAAKFWPGPLTLVLPRSPTSTISDLAAAGLETLALRVPRGKTAMALLREVGLPVAAPSANVSGTVSPSDAQHVLRSLDGKIDAILDSGPCSVGVESTVLDLTRETPVLLRPGGITLEALTEVIGKVHHPDDFTEVLPASPGRLASHYAPSLPVRLDVTSVEPDEALLAFGKPLLGAGATWNLSETEDLEQAAARLFAGLRFLDTEGTRRGLKRIAVQPVPRHDLGLAIRDRLRRAAEPRGPDMAS
ncbi:L-threonylcarbamoyladenylate synthase [Gluconobacter morbifer]|uniref:Threonylcarbamoyl-AMP synthase n=1 Tax=Gluconobacter morbifer G707 TaxID=1088869 RepID=G6XLD4_9PROT|nr:L-threonylcarbamoyladenylate synthase [Gluconobacter morbifer]EHH67189.1 hypothetical protein GMO_21820 [Gluconobacter morbifer G707]